MRNGGLDPHGTKRNIGKTCDLPEVVSHRFPANDTGTWRNRSGSQFWTSEVEGDFASFACFLLGSPQVLDHAKPLLGTIVSTVYAHDIHSVIQKIANKDRIVSGLAWHGNHNANISIARGLAKRFDRVFLKESRTLLPTSQRLFEKSWRLPSGCVNRSGQRQGSAECRTAGTASRDGSNIGGARTGVEYELNVNGNDDDEDDSGKLRRELRATIAGIVGIKAIDQSGQHC
jgi:hypothetical protein